MNPIPETPCSIRFRVEERKTGLPGEWQLIMKPLWSWFLAAPLLLVMYATWVVFVMVALDMGTAWDAGWDAGWGAFKWFIAVLSVAVPSLVIVGALTRLTTKQILVRSGQMFIEKRILGIGRRFNIQDGELEMLRKHASEDLADEPWSSELSVVEPTGNRVSLFEASFEDQRFASSLMKFLSQVTTWRVDVKDIYESPPKAGDSST